jgi:hypothetical protein
MRTIIDLKEQQVDALKELSIKTRLSRAELIRRAVNEYLVKMKPQDHKDAFGLWKNKAPDGLVYQEALRREWGDDEGSA